MNVVHAVDRRDFAVSLPELRIPAFNHRAAVRWQYSLEGVFERTQGKALPSLDLVDDRVIVVTSPAALDIDQAAMQNSAGGAISG